MGLPAKCIQTIDREWLINDEEERISGHVYVNIFDIKKKKWLLIDPTTREIISKIPSSRIIFGEGLDSWGLGIVDFYSLKDKFLLFKKNWLKNFKKKK